MNKVRKTANQIQGANKFMAGANKAAGDRMSVQPGDAQKIQPRPSMGVGQKPPTGAQSTA